MASAGDISVQLVLSGAEVFLRRVDRSSKSLDKYSRSVGAAARNTDTLLSRTRDLAIILGLARSAVENLGLIFTGLPVAILKQNAQLEQSQALIAGMDTGAENYADAMKRAEGTVRDLIQMSSSSPFAIDAITDSFAKLKSANIPETTMALEALVNAAAKSGASSEGLRRASIAVQQIFGKNVVSMEELRQQLGEAIPQVMRYMSRATRMEMGEMVKLISSGSMEASSSMRELFNEMAFASMGAAQAMSKTLEGTFNRVKNAFTLLSKEIGDADFSDAMKDLGEGLIEYLSTDEAIEGAREIGKALAYIVELLGDIARVVGENLRLITALVAGYAAIKIGNGAKNALVGFWTQASQAQRQYESRMERFMRRTNRDIARHVKDIEGSFERSTKATIAYAKQNSHATSAMLGAIRDQHMRVLNEQSAAQIRKVENLQRVYQSTFYRLKGIGGQFFGAMGGWVTIAVVAVQGLIWIYDELYGKQKRATEELLKQNGLNATALQLQAAKKTYEDLKKERERLKKLAKGDDLGSVGDFNPLNDPKMAKKRLAAVEKEMADIERVVDNGTRSMIQRAEKAGESMASALLGETEIEVGKKYEQQAEEVTQTAKTLGLKGEQMKQFSKDALENLRRQAIAAIEAQADVEKARIRVEMATLYDKRAKSGLTAQETEELANYEGQLQSIAKRIEDYKRRVNMGEILTLSMSDAKLTAEQTYLQQLIRQKELYEQKYDTLKNEGAYAENYAKLMADINSGRLKVEGEIREELEREAKAADAAHDAYSKLVKATQQRKEAQRDIDAINDRLNNMLLAMSKRLGTSQGKSLNEFMKWKVAADQNTQAIAQMAKQYNEAIAKAKTMGLKVDFPELKFGELNAMAEQMKINDIIAQQEKYAYDLRLNSLNALERFNLETEKTKSDLQEVRRSLVRQQDNVSRNTDEYWRLQQAIDAVNASLEAAADEAERVHPETNAFAEYSKQIDEMGLQIDEQLVGAFDGLLDGFIDNMFDAEFSFSDMIQNMTKDLAKFMLKLAMLQGMKALFGNVFADGGVMTPDGEMDLSAFANGGVMTPKGEVKLSAFEKGGVMTPYGELPLKAYSKGGIATSPQLALYGEGKQPEAYVPLPDGRTIPVTLDYIQPSLEKAQQTITPPAATKVSLNPPPVELTSPAISIDSPQMPEINLPPMPKIELPELKAQEVSVQTESPQMPAARFGLEEKALPDISVLAPLTTAVAAAALPKIMMRVPESSLPDIALPEISSPAIDVSMPEAVQEAVQVSTTLPEIAVPEMMSPTLMSVASEQQQASESKVSTALLASLAAMGSMSLPAAAMPVMPEMPAFSEMSLAVPEVPEMTLSAPALPELSSLQAPVLPAMSIAAPELSPLSVQVPELPQLQASVPELPEFTVNHAALGVNLPELGVNLPELGVNLPELSVPQMALPEMSIAAPTLDMTLPELPELSLPELSQLDIAANAIAAPELPQLAISLPEYPELPDYPAMPVVSQPDPVLSESVTQLANQTSLPEYPELPTFTVDLPQPDPVSVVSDFEQFVSPQFQQVTESIQRIEAAQYQNEFSPELPAISAPAISLPEINVPAEDARAVSLPDISVPAISLPEMSVPEMAIAAPSTELDATINSPTISVPDISVPELPSLNATLFQSAQMAGIRMPNINLPSPNVNLPSPNVNLPQPAISLPEPNIHLPEPNQVMNWPEMSLPETSQTFNWPQTSLPELPAMPQLAEMPQMPEFSFRQPEFVVPDDLVNTAAEVVARVSLPATPAAAGYGDVYNNLAGAVPDAADRFASLAEYAPQLGSPYAAGDPFTPAAMAASTSAADKRNSDDGAPVFNLINQTGVQAEFETKQQFNGEKYVTDIVMKAASRPGKFRNSLKGR